MNQYLGLIAKVADNSCKVVVDGFDYLRLHGKTAQWLCSLIGKATV